MNKLIINIILITIFFSSQFYSQVFPFDSPDWKIEGKEHNFENYKGKPSLYLKAASAELKNVKFRNGIIEYDIAFSSDRGFPSVYFRKQDDFNYEQFYVRPAQSGRPDANQYTPVFNGVPAWQLYHGEGYSASTVYKFDEWNHIKIVVNEKQGEVYINDMKTPQFFINEFKRDVKSGTVGIAVPNFSGAYYTNFTVLEIENPKLVGKPKEVIKKHKNVITWFSISNPFPFKNIENKTSINKDDFKELKWWKVESEKTGILNISRYAKIDTSINTVFVKIIVESEIDQIKAFDFGYSDNVHLYSNGKLIYGGTNLYRSRDFRYLGTIGLFDEVYLDLQKGNNEIIIAVSEAFGGWGVLAAFDNMDKIKLK